MEILNGLLLAAHHRDRQGNWEGGLGTSFSDTPDVTFTAVMTRLPDSAAPRERIWRSCLGSMRHTVRPRSPERMPQWRPGRTQKVTPGGCEGALGHDGWKVCRHTMWAGRLPVAG
jgi:hypothetical protein